MRRTYSICTSFPVFCLLLSLATAAVAEEPAPGAAPMGRTFPEAYRAALGRSETVALQAEVLAQAEERYNQVRAGILPSLNAFGSYLRQETPTGVGGAIFPGEQKTARISLTQPIFRGFREFAAIRQQKSTIAAQSFARDQAAAQLYSDVALSYYNVLAYESDIHNYEIEIQANRKRVTELSDRIKIGRSRLTEKLTVEAQIANLEAAQEQTRAQLFVARDLFGFLTGWPSTTPLVDTATLLARAPDLQDFVRRVDERPDIRAELQRVQASEEAINVAWGGHLPSADLAADYYLARPGAQKDVHWSVAATVSLPLYLGGAINSQVREARIVRTQEDIILSRLRRQAENDIRAAYDTLASDLTRLEILKRAAEVNERNFQAQSRDYRFGLVTNLDVIQALTSYQEARRALNRVTLSVKYDAIRLDAVSFTNLPSLKGP